MKNWILRLKVKLFGFLTALSGVFQLIFMIFKQLSLHCLSVHT